MNKVESKRSRLLKFLIKHNPAKNRWNLTGDALGNYVKKRQGKDRDKYFIKLIGKFDVDVRDINGHDCYIIKPADKKISKKHILYLHGGGFIYEMTSLHWLFIKTLCDRLNCTIILPIYPLSPKYQYKDIFKMLIAVYEEIIKKVKPENLTVMGDSAGGGLTLALCMLLKKRDMPQPKDAILISPVLDMSFKNPNIPKIAKRELIIGIPALKTIADWYIGDDDVNDYLISPINGDYDGLCNISLFMGTHDILYPDAKKFYKRMEKAGKRISYYEYKKMLHIWALMPIPEGRHALDKICKIISAK